MATNKGWKVKLEFFVPADDKNPKSVSAAADIAGNLQDLKVLREMANCPTLELTNSSAEFISRKAKTTAPATPK